MSFAVRLSRTLVLAGALACAPAVFAQQSITFASLTGRVTDSAGAALPGASVVARHLERNQQQLAVAGGDGRFRLLSLPVGAYELEVSAAGFVTRKTSVTLRVGDALDLPIALGVAGLVAHVDVAADAPLVETRRTQIAQVITPREIDELPLNGRNYLDLALLSPGVSRTVQRNTERFAETSAVPGTGISVGAQRNLNNTFIVDGVSANDDAAGLAGTYFAEEVIREFQVVTSGGIAEFGRASAGIVNVVTRSGGNARAGRAYGFFRHDALDARNALATSEDPLTQAQYGLTLSGPIARDRTFWFANGERTQLDRTGTVTIQTNHVEAVNEVLARTGYAGPRLTRGDFPTGYDTTNAFGRIDDGAGSHRLSVRYSLYDVTSENARTVGGLNAVTRGTSLEDRDQTVALSWLTTRANASLNELRAQVTRSRLAAPSNDAIGPAVTISGVANFGAASSSPAARALDVYEISDSYAQQRGSHLIKAGASMLYEHVRIDFPGPTRGAYAFASMADFRAGRYINYQQAFGEAVQAQSNPNVGLFVQDEWRPRHDLTINAGLRYDLQWLEDPVETDTNNVSPRLGISFAPGTGRTVVRASAGLYYDRIPLRALSNALQRDGVKYRAALLTFGQGSAPGFPAVLDEFPAGVLTNITSVDPHIESGVGRQVGIEVERQIGNAVSATIGYMHTTGRHIIMSRNLNVPTLTVAQAAAIGDPNLGRPDPRFGNNAQYQSIGQSCFDGLTAAVNTRSGRWGSLRTAYTLSKALDDTGNAFFSSPQDNFDVQGDWGRSDNDQRHRLTISGTTGTIAGLRLAGLFSYSSAPPFNIQTGNDRNHDTNANDRPEGVGRNTGEGFDSATLDLRVSRSIALGGASRVEVMLDAFNVFNRTNFLIPNNTFGSGAVPLPSFGRPTAAADPRQVQLGIRWSF